MFAIRRLWLVTLLLVLFASPAIAQNVAESEVAEVLDALHKAASDADFDGYFSLFAAESVFLGTDATERWDRAAFMAFARPIFEGGRGWTYTPLERHISIAEDGASAWFDERLDNANLGECRGSGVLIREDGSWKVAQYNLTIPVPNALAGEFVARIRSFQAGQDGGGGQDP